MMTTLQPVTSTFQATWTSQNSHLRNDPGFLKKVCRVAWNVISILIPIILVVRLIGWAVASLAKRATLPSAHFYSPAHLQEIRDYFNAFCFGPITDENRDLRKAFEVERHTVVTPDQHQLSAIHFRHKNATEETPTLLFFQPNMSVSEHIIHSPLLEEAMRRECNVVVFDYRSVSYSGGKLEQPLELVIDGESAFQFVTTQLGVPVNKVRIWGYSLGGAVSANVKAIHPECKAEYLNERSLSSTSDVVRAHLTGLKKLLLFWLPCAMQAGGWDLKAPIEKVRGPIMIVYHDQDETIPYNASCHQQAIRTASRFASVRLTTGPLLRQMELLKFRIYHHANPLRDYVITSHGNQRADKLIYDFIFGSRSARQNMVA